MASELMNHASLLLVPYSLISKRLSQLSIQYSENLGKMEEKNIAVINNNKKYS
jgi:hypothetical protein